MLLVYETGFVLAKHQGDIDGAVRFARIIANNTRIESKSPNRRRKYYLDYYVENMGEAERKRYENMQGIKHVVERYRAHVAKPETVAWMSSFGPQ